jgi:peptidoglycan/LPS O-acetylase OafA/YrhL
MQRSAEGRPPQTRFVTWIGVAMTLAAIYIMSLQQPDSMYMGVGMFTPIGGVLNNFILPICYSMIYYGLIVEQTWLRRALATDIMVLLGKSSYIYYLIHMGLVQAIVERISPDFRTLHGWIIQFILLNCIAIMMFRFLEEPLNNWIRRKWQWGVRASS